MRWASPASARAILTWTPISPPTGFKLQGPLFRHPQRSPMRWLSTRRGHSATNEWQQAGLTPPNHVKAKPLGLGVFERKRRLDGALANKRRAIIIRVSGVRVPPPACRRGSAQAPPDLWRCPTAADLLLVEDVPPPIDECEVGTALIQLQSHCAVLEEGHGQPRIARA